MPVTEEQAEKMRLAAERLAQAERVLMRARQDYNKAMKAWDNAAQVKLDTEKNN
jgi:hypothetical protein